MSDVATIAVLAGDGIGPEVMREAVAVLRAVERRYARPLEIVEAPVGWAGIDACGSALPPATLALCRRSDAILFGSVGLPDRDPTIPPQQRPERASLLLLRREFGLYANLRPVHLLPELTLSCPLRPERFANGIDLLVVRELTGGLYFGTPKETRDLGNGVRSAVDSLVYSTPEIARIAHVAFREAQRRSRRLTSVDKANVLESGALWREVVTEVGREYPDVQLQHMFIDNAAMQLLRQPGQFDVLLCENTFGDILSDEAAALVGSLGMLPSASLGEAAALGRAFGLYEPAGGTAPDIAGKGVANPIAQILSAALLLRHSLGMEEAAHAVEQAVRDTIARGLRTADIYVPTDKTATRVSTHEMGQAIIDALRKADA